MEELDYFFNPTPPPKQAWNDRVERSLAVSHRIHLTDRHTEDKCFIPASFFLWISGEGWGGWRVDRQGASIDFVFSTCSCYLLRAVEIAHSNLFPCLFLAAILSLLSLFMSWKSSSSKGHCYNSSRHPCHINEDSKRCVNTLQYSKVSYESTLHSLQPIISTFKATQKHVMARQVHWDRAAKDCF